MPEIEMDINYLVTCIESINQISTIPAVEGLKKVVNGWVDERTDEALADPAIRLQIYSIWKKLSGDSDSEKVVEVIASLPENLLGSEIRQFFLAKVNEQLDEAMKDPANKMLFFRSWLATPSENIAGQDSPSTDQLVEEATADGGSTLPEHGGPQHVW